MKQNICQLPKTGPPCLRLKSRGSRAQTGLQSIEPKEKMGYRTRPTGHCGGRAIGDLPGMTRVRLRAARVDAASVAPDRGTDPSCWLCQSRAGFVGVRGRCLRAGLFSRLVFRAAGQVFCGSLYCLREIGCCGRPRCRECRERRATKGALFGKLEFRAWFIVDGVEAGARYLSAPMCVCCVRPAQRTMCSDVSKQPSWDFCSEMVYWRCDV